MLKLQEIKTREQKIFSGGDPRPPNSTLLHFSASLRSLFVVSLSTEKSLKEALSIFDV